MDEGTEALRFRGIETIHTGPDAIEVRNQSFRRGQAGATVLWMVFAINLLLGAPGSVFRAIAVVLVLSSVFLFWKTVHAGIVRLDESGSDIMELNGVRHLDRSEIQWFSTQVGPSGHGREVLTVRLRGNETLVVRSIYATRFVQDSGKSAVRQVADDLNRVLWDLRADEPLT